MDNISEQVKAMINAVGALAEIELQHYHALIGAGATVEEACMLTKVFIQAIFSTKPHKEDEE